MPPLIPYPILGTVTDSAANILTSVNVVLTNTTKSSNPLTVATDSNGKYVADAGNFDTGYSSGDTVSVTVSNTFKDETKTITFTISGSTKKNLNIQTEVILTLPEGYVGRTNKTSLVNASNLPYQKTNPLPVIELITNEIVLQDILFPLFTYDSSDNLLEMTMRLDGVDYKQIFTWDSNDNVTSISKWVKQ